MKRIITYISILAAVLTAGVSCTREVIDGNQDGGALTLCFKTQEMGTRVTVADGENVLGIGAENAIEYVDYFFFADTDPSSAAIKSGRLLVEELNKVSDTEYTYGFDTTEGEYEILKGKSYLYVLVNYPGEVNVTTMNELLSLPISTDFNKAQTSFVMDSYDNGNVSGLIGLTPTQPNEERTVVVKLARCAAKLVLNIDVKNTFTDESGNLWKPVTSQMWVNFVNARNNTTVDAEAVEFDNKSSYYTSTQKAPTHTTDKAGYTGWRADAVYSYPQTFTVSDITAPYFKIFCPWVCDGKGTNNFYYKILLPQLGSFQRNKIYTMTVDLSVIGSTEDDWALATRYIGVAGWNEPAKIEATFEGAMYLDVPVKYYEIYGVDDIYIPVLSSNDIQVTGLTGTKTNLYNGNSVSVSATTSDISKDGFKLTHTLNNDITSDDFDCTPITYTMTVQHKEGGLSKTINVTVVQYPSIYAKADESNGYAYVNSFTRSGANRGGRYASGYAYNNRGNSNNTSDQLGTINSGNAQNSNYNQYVITVSVLPEGYKVAGMAEEVVIGDPRGGRLAYNYLGYTAGTNGDNGTASLTVQANYNAVATNTQNVIAPAIRIASSWGATNPILNYNRAEERCASYQENGYPAGRWRMPTVAEIDFLIRLSDYQHIPALFSPEYHSDQWGGYYDVYWAGGTYGYGGKPYTDRNHTNAFINLTGANQYSDGTIGVYVGSREEYFKTYMRCVYDEWYWSDTKYGNSGTPGTAATRWIGYIY